MIKINVLLSNIAWKKYLREPQIFINKKISKINKREKKKILFLCSLVLSNTKEIRKLNNKFRKKNKSTDVLSFPFYNKNQLQKMIKLKKEVYLGDIIINLNKIKKKNYNIEFQNNFNKLWVHGLVHLFGHLHKKESDYKKMHKVEKKYLDILNDE